MKQINSEPKIEEIMAWAFHLYGEKYSYALKNDRILRVDLEHYAEQNLTKIKQKRLEARAR